MPQIIESFKIIWKPIDAAMHPDDTKLISYKRFFALIVAFIVGYGMVVRSGHDPTVLMWDWQAFCMGLLGAGIAQPALSTASIPVQIITTVGAFLFGYGYIEASSGYRYAINCNWEAIIFGFTTCGAVHVNNQNVTQPIIQALTNNMNQGEQKK